MYFSSPSVWLLCCTKRRAYNTVRRRWTFECEKCAPQQLGRPAWARRRFRTLESCIPGQLGWWKHQKVLRLHAEFCRWVRENSGARAKFYKQTQLPHPGALLCAASWLNTKVMHLQNAFHCCHIRAPAYCAPQQCEAAILHFVPRAKFWGG